VEGTPRMIASQWRRLEAEIGAREERMGEGSVMLVLSSWRRRFVLGGVGEREGLAIVGDGEWKTMVCDGWMSGLGVGRLCKCDAMTVFWLRGEDGTRLRNLGRKKLGICGASLTL